MRIRGKIDLDAKPQLYQMLKLNEKVEFNERDGTFVYKVCHGDSSFAVPI
jgi:hypothetical protein